MARKAGKANSAKGNWAYGYPSAGALVRASRKRGPYESHTMAKYLPLKTPRIGEVFIFYRYIAHVTQKVTKRFVFLRGKNTAKSQDINPLAEQHQP